MRDFHERFIEYISGQRRGAKAAFVRFGLSALSLPYRLACQARRTLYGCGLLLGHELESRVVSVGNLTTGGTGKTPLVIWIARWLQQRSISVAILSRGYGAREPAGGRETDETLLLRRHLPAVPHLVGRKRYLTGQRALAEHGAECIVLDDGFQHLAIGRDLNIVVIDALVPFGYGHLLPRGLLREPLSALRRADLILYNSGTTLSYGRWKYDWNRTVPLAMPLVMARGRGKPYGIYCQSFERFAWPSNELFVPLLSSASFVFVRDGNSLEYLKSLGVKPPVLEFGPDATFAFDLRDEPRADAFMERHRLKPRKFITITIRTSGQGFIDQTREQAHAAKLRELIETWVDRTGHDVLICPEVVHEIEPARRLIYDRLSEEVRRNVRFKEEFWLPDEAFSVYARAEAIVSMEMHSVILGLAAGTPVVHPRFVEAGRKAWMLRDLGLEAWLFDIDREPAERITASVLAVHDDYDAALAKVKSAMGVVHKRQAETMAVVRGTLAEARAARSGK